MSHNLDPTKLVIRETKHETTILQTVREKPLTQIPVATIYGTTNEEVSARARLFVQSPLMLAALKEMCDLLLGSTDVERDLYPDERAALAKGLAAIAEAEGMTT